MPMYLYLGDITRMETRRHCERRRHGSAALRNACDFVLCRCWKLRTTSAVATVDA